AAPPDDLGRDRARRARTRGRVCGRSPLPVSGCGRSPHPPAPSPAQRGRGCHPYLPPPPPTTQGGADAYSPSPSQWGGGWGWGLPGPRHRRPAGVAGGTVVPTAILTHSVKMALQSSEVFFIESTGRPPALDR